MIDPDNLEDYTESKPLTDKERRNFWLWLGSAFAAFLALLLSWMYV